MDPLAQALVAAIFFFAILTQTVAGFGLGLISLPLLIPILGIRTAAPIVALVNLIAIALIFVKYRRAFHLRDIKPLMIAASFGIPLGVFAVKIIPETYTLTALGILILSYALYAYFTPKVPQIRHALWAYGLGFISGVCGGAYNSSGPASVLYAHSQNWNPDAFRSNLQAYFIFNSVLINIAHLLSGNVKATILHGFLLSVPGILLGLPLGFYLSRRLNADRFRTLVLALLGIMGLRLIAANAF